VRATILRAGRFTCSVALSGLLLLPLSSLFQHPAVTVAMKALVAGLWLLAASWPPAGVLATAVGLPLALSIEHFLGPLPEATGVTEALLLALASGAALRLTIASPESRDRLSRPALMLGALIAASLIVSLFAQQAASPTRNIGFDLWRHVTTRYLFAVGPWSELHQAVRWLSVLAVAVFVERALRKSPAMALMTARMMLVGAAAAASFAALRIAQVLIEGRVSPDRWEIVRFLLREYRISALHPDPNAAGSYFALLLVPALILAVRHRNRWLAIGVVPLLSVAFLFAKSRAAMLAGGIVIGLMTTMATIRSRRYVLTAAVVMAIAVAGYAASAATRTSNASLGRAALIRQELTQVALEMTRDHPVFGVGIGRFRPLSRFYITEDLPQLRRWAPRGQNAHNNFLQVLGELGLPGLVAFVWMVVPGARRWLWTEASSSEQAVYACALAAGLATFLITAIFGHPLLVVQVAAAFFLVLGLTSALLPAPAGPGHASRIVVLSTLAIVVVTLPWRIAEARTAARDVEGLSRVAGMLDDVPYRTAAPVAIWRIGSETQLVTLPLRWQAPAPEECAVDVIFDGHAADRLRPSADAWLPLRLSLPPAGSRLAIRELELRTSDPRCTLLVGPLRTVD
jgi:O-antigen ligase